MANSSTKQLPKRMASSKAEIRKREADLAWKQGLRDAMMIFAFFAIVAFCVAAQVSSGVAK